MGNDLKDGKQRLDRHSRSAAAAIEKELDLDYGSFHWEDSLKQLESQQDAQALRHQFLEDFVNGCLELGWRVLRAERERVPPHHPYARHDRQQGLNCSTQQQVGEA